MYANAGSFRPVRVRFLGVFGDAGRSESEALCAAGPAELPAASLGDVSDRELTPTTARKTVTVPPVRAKPHSEPGFSFVPNAAAH